MKYILLLIFICSSFSDVYGQYVWQKRYVIPPYPFEYVYSVLETSDNSIMVTGIDNYYGSFITKFSASGDSLWTKFGIGGIKIDSYSFNRLVTMHGADSLFKIINYNGDLLKVISTNGYEFYGLNFITTGNNDYIISGHRYFNPFVIKYDSSGSRIWNYTFFQGTSDGYLSGICKDKNNNVYITGGIDHSGYFGNLLLYKISFEGNIIWQKEFKQYLYPDKIVYLNDSNIFITGTNSKGMYIFKTTSNGDSLWLRNYDTSLNIISRGMDIVVNNSSVNILGNVISNNEYCNIRLSKMDLDGNLIWHKKYGDSLEYNLGVNIRQCRDSGFILCNIVDESPKPNYLIKTDKNGNTGNFIGIKKISDRIELENLKIYPNPFNSTFKISANLTHASYLNINIYDINGRQIEKVYNGNFIGHFNKLIDMRNYSSSIYFLVFNINNKSFSKKIILTK